MGVTSAVAGRWLGRSATWFDPTRDWTRFCWVRYAVSNPADYYTAWVFSDDVDASNWSIGMYAYQEPLLGGQFVQDLEVYTAAHGAIEYVQTPITPGVWFWIAARHIAALDLFELIISGSVAASITLPIANLAPAAQDYMIGDSFTASLAGCAVAYERVWQRALTLWELNRESCLVRGAVLDQLLADSPLTGPDQLSDVTGYGRSYVAMGGELAYQTGPLPRQVVLPLPAPAHIGGPPPINPIVPAQFSPAGLVGTPLTLLEQLPDRLPTTPADAPTVYATVDRLAIVEAVLAVVAYPPGTIGCQAMAAVEDVAAAIVLAHSDGAGFLRWEFNEGPAWNGHTCVRGDGRRYWANMIAYPDGAFYWILGGLGGYGLEPYWVFGGFADPGLYSAT